MELREPVGDRVEDDLTLEAGLLRATLADLDHPLEPVRRRACLVEAVVGTIDVGLLGRQVWVDRHVWVVRSFWADNPGLGDSKA